METNLKSQNSGCCFSYYWRRLTGSDLGLRTENHDSFATILMILTIVVSLTELFIPAPLSGLPVTEVIVSDPNEGRYVADLLVSCCVMVVI